METDAEYEAFFGEKRWRYWRTIRPIFITGGSDVTLEMTNCTFGGLKLDEAPPPPDDGEEVG